MKKFTLIVCVMAAASALCFGAKKKSVTKKLPAPQGTNELAGKTLVSKDDDGSVTKYEFGERNLTVTVGFDDIGFYNQDILEYSWNADEKSFWTKCVSKGGRTSVHQIADDFTSNSIFGGRTRAEFVEDAVAQIEEIEGPVNGKAKKNLCRRIESEINEDIRLATENARREMERVTKWHYVLAGDDIRFLALDFDPKTVDWYDWKFTAGNTGLPISLQKIARYISEEESVVYRFVSATADTAEYMKVSNFYGMEDNPSAPKKLVFSYEIKQRENGSYYLVLRNGSDIHELDFCNTPVVNVKFRQ